MTIDEQTIRSLLDDNHINHINEGLFIQVSNSFIERLTNGINAVLSTTQQVGYIEEELAGLKENYEENCAELDIELGRLVKACKHPSWTGGTLVICNICGGIVEEEICGI